MSTVFGVIFRYDTAEISLVILTIICGIEIIDIPVTTFKAEGDSCFIITEVMNDKINESRRVCNIIDFCHLATPIISMSFTCPCDMYFRGLITVILFGADQLSNWCAPIVWLVLTDFKLVLTDFSAGRYRFFSCSLSIHNANIANNPETMYKYLHIFIKLP